MNQIPFTLVSPYEPDITLGLAVFLIFCYFATAVVLLVGLGLLVSMLPVWFTAPLPFVIGVLGFLKYGIKRR